MNNKLTDDRIIKFLNSCYNTHGVIIAHVIDRDEEHLISLQDVIDILNRQKAEIEWVIDNAKKRHTEDSHNDNR